MPPSAAAASSTIAAHRLGVGEVGADDDVALARQRRRDSLGALRRGAVVDGDAVAALGEARATAAPIPREAPVTRTARLMAAMVPRPMLVAT